MKWLNIVLTLVALITLGFPARVAAHEMSFGVGLYVKHYVTSKNTVEGIENHLLLFEYNHLALAEFCNSYGDETGFIGYGIHTRRFVFTNDYWLRGNCYAGVLLGYGDHSPINFKGISPGFFPTFEVGKERWSIETGIMPTFVWWALKYSF